MLDAVAAFRADQGPEYTGKALDQCAYEHKVELKLIQLDKPTENGCIERFNKKFRNECLNQHWLEDLAHARQLISQWRVDYS